MTFHILLHLNLHYEDRTIYEITIIIIYKFFITVALVKKQVRLNLKMCENNT